MSTTEQNFADHGVRQEIVEALEAVGITHPFPIQAMTLPVASSGHDIIGQAKTGTGKTLGFGIPVLQQVHGPADPGYAGLDSPGAPQALIVVPTRELAVQVANDLSTASKNLSHRVLTVYGGRAYEPQIEALRKGIEVVVGTPGRLIDLAQQGHLRLGHVRHVVLDEADEMLDLGFLPDVEKLIAQTPAGRQTMLFSATMPSAIVALARRYMTQPTHIRAAEPDDHSAFVKAIAQFVYRAHSLDKIEMIARILQARGRGLTIIFTKTKRAAAKVSEELAERGFAAAAIHGDLGQGAREQALRAFRNGKVDILVATDVAARGIDVEDVTHVMNYTCPDDEKTYLHRIGRTGRAGNTGTAVTFVDWDDLHRWAMISKSLDLGIPEPDETYSTSPRLFTDMDIPEGTKGMLPRAARTREGLGAERVEDLGETGGRRPRSGPGGGGGSRSGSGGGSRSGSGRRDDHRGTDRAGDSAAVGADGSTGQASETGDPAATGERAPRTRARRRTRRSGGDETGTAVATEGSEASSSSSSNSSDNGTAPQVGDDATSDSATRPRRRRRRRSGSSSAALESTAPASSD